MSMSPVAYRSFRLSMRWLPQEASEPTSTIVLTGAKTGVFLDTRFFKGTREIDWAFAGYRLTDPNAPNVIKFRHDIDSRTLDCIEDSGTNTALPDGTTLEEGEMINPATDRMARFEEIWRDEEESDGRTVLFIRNVSGTNWQGRAGNYQLALGREADGIFWAWQAQKEAGGVWSIENSSATVVPEQIIFLPDYGETKNWREGSNIEWLKDNWVVLECGKT